MNWLTTRRVQLQNRAACAVEISTSISLYHLNFKPQVLSTTSSDEEYEEPDRTVIEIAAGVKVYESDLKILRNQMDWLNARLMNAGQTLL